MPLRSDIPITDASHDLFSRKPLTDILVKAIREYASYSTNCITIGIYGAWGEGKTSVMNIVRTRLEQLKYKDHLMIASYNPWLIKDQESMLVDFFRTIMGAGFSRKLFSYFKQYGNLISYIAGQVSDKVAPLSSGTVSSLIGKIIDGLPSADLSLTECKRRVSEQLKKENKHLVVFIDDLDRLNRNEIHTVFRLIKQVADFENVIYLVAMDVDRVSDALGSKNMYGTRYIDKIIQIPVTLPKLQIADLRRELWKMLSDLKEELNIPDNRLDIDSVVGSIIGLIRNERDITRFYNSLLLVLPSVKDELNLNDFCLLEYLNMYKSSIYDGIFRKRTELLRLNTFDVYSPLNSSKTEENIQKRFDNTVEEFRLEYGSEVSNLIKDLFPKVYPGIIKTAYERTRINRNEFFDRYFIRNYQEGSVPHAEVSMLLSSVLTASDQEIVHIINRWLDISDPVRTFAALDDVIMGDDHTATTRAKRAKRIISAILASDIPNKLFFYQIEGTHYASHIVLWLQMYLFDVDENGNRKYLVIEINDIVSDIFQNADLKFCMEFLLSFNRSLGEHLTLDAFTILRDRVVERDNEDSYEEIIQYSRDVIQAFFVLWNRLDPKTMHVTINKWLHNKDFASEVLIQKFIDNDSAFIYDLQLFVALFESEIESYMDHVTGRLASPITDVFYKKVFANWRITLENYKKGKQL